MENKDKNKKDNSIKIILLGNQAVGKTALISAYEDKQFSHETISTIGSEYIYKKLKIDEKEYKVQLWDTAGQEKFRSVSKIYFKDSDIVIFVYDITNEKSFNDLGEFWIGYVKDLIGNDKVFGIASNKIDLFENKKVEKEEGEKFAEDNGALFCETSAKEDPKGFQKFVNDLIVTYISKRKNVKKEQNINLNKNKLKKNKKNCC